jgi:hypothetical protein
VPLGRPDARRPLRGDEPCNWEFREEQAADTQLAPPLRPRSPSAGDQIDGRYDPLYDVNDDRRIDSEDLELVVAQAP